MLFAVAPLLFFSLGSVSLPTLNGISLSDTTVGIVAKRTEPKVPLPDPLHASWGPEPPVAPFSSKPAPETGKECSITFPLIGPCAYEHSYNLDYGGYRHTGIDIRAPKFTPIVAPFSGILGFKKDTFWIYGDNGWITLGTHLNDDSLNGHDHRGDRDLMFAPYLKPYQRVYAGEFLGYVGMSGDATGPHLHFELYCPGSGRTEPRITDPFPSLAAAKRISEPISLFTADGTVPAHNQVRLYGSIRGWDASGKGLTLLLIAKQDSSGSFSSSTYPHWITLHLQSKDVKDLGGTATIESLPKTAVVSFLAEYSGHSDAYESRGMVPVTSLRTSLSPIR